MKAAIIGAPLDLGAGRRGVDMGPSAIRYAGLEDRLAALGIDVVDRGNVATPVDEATTEHDERARFLPATPRAVRAERRARRWGPRRGPGADRARRRPLDRPRPPRRPRRPPRPG